MRSTNLGGGKVQSAPVFVPQEICRSHGATSRSGPGMYALALCTANCSGSLGGAVVQAMITTSPHCPGAPNVHLCHQPFRLLA